MGEAAGLPDKEVRARVARLDDLLERLERTPGPVTQAAMEAIEALTEVYGTALARVVALVDSGAASVRSLAADEVVGHLMLLHGLHPDPPEQRIARVLAEMRQHLGDGGEAELTGIQDGVAKIRLSVGGCRSTAAGLASSVRDAVLAAAPELADVDPVIVRPPAAPALIPAETLLRRPAASR
jgi:Fe-S cluster biogenesis protein NfuA